MEKEKVGLYIHIPFCSKKCDYCDFISYATDEKAQNEYLDHLTIEIELMRRKMIGKVVDSIYIGGGTPSYVFDGFIISLMHNIYSNFEIDKGCEITIEVNPASLTDQKMVEYRLSGITRISVGLQCLDENVLKNVGRLQSLKDVDRAFKILQKAKFQNVSVDIMLGLPKQTKKMLERTLKYVIAKNVKHISLYSLQLESGTPLYKRVIEGSIDIELVGIENNLNHTSTESGQRKSNGIILDAMGGGKDMPMSNDQCFAQYNYAVKILRNAGFHRYEVSNFSKTNYNSKHNIKYWERTPYIGLGVSAHSFFDGYRYSNTNRLDTYNEKLDKGQLPIVSKEYIDRATQRTETIMLSLRMQKGIDLIDFKDRLNEDLLITKKNIISRLESLGLVKVTHGYLRITDENFYVANQIILELI